MAYITSESVKEIRNNLKVLFPAKQGWKFSVTRQHYSNVRCEILTAPVELRLDTTRTNESVNNFWIESRYDGNNDAATAILKSINDILNLNNYDNSDAQTDYFDCGHYVTLTIGAWDKPFQVVA
ncbi:LPD29 domain-containing protein [Flavobacterium muglaense]|uniref:Large polyvalent protein associated domain-containing protein n=1 Tax=Flavobacterium muglaense TaxID=2764716 RepID=A0A923MYA1_9FLAO|nr:LPD29 domain-containing protein [Flavobacterium muglaense]MBC5836776.1 hypothetical protein [Flavobacterium muglaense]MBC5843274.1 hypothetical protein [Flavobacterium muglaense]